MRNNVIKAFLASFLIFASCSDDDGNVIIDNDDDGAGVAVPEDPVLTRDVVISEFSYVNDWVELQNISDEILNQKPEEENKSSLGAILDFRAFHEAYHMGQLTLLRSIIGKSNLR